MNILLHKIGVTIIGVLMSIGLSLGFVHAPLKTAVKPVSSNLGTYSPSGGGTYYLKSSIASTDTTIKLSTFKEPVSGIAYTMSYLNTNIGYGTLDPQTVTRREFISFTGITQNSDGTATLTGVSRGLDFSYPYTASSTLRQAHPGQTAFILSDSPEHFSEYAVKQNNESITGLWTIPEPVAASNPATKNYVDTKVNGGTVSIEKVSMTATAGETVTTGQIVYLSRYDGFWYKASASLASTSQNVMLGVAQGSGTAGVAISGGVLVRGNDTTQVGMTTGNFVYLSNTAGATSTSAGTRTKIIGQARTATSLYVDTVYDGNFGSTNAATSTATNEVSKGFGGTGVDGALTLTSGVTTLDLASTTYFQKNYTSISITGTGQLAFSHANGVGTIVKLKSQGDCTITSSGNPAIDGRGLGAMGGGYSLASATGTAGTLGFSPLSAAAGSGLGGGAFVGGSGSGPGGATGGLAASSSLPQMAATTSIYALRFIPIVMGSGGGGGGSGSNAIVGGGGGRGGGAIILECGGNLNFTSTVSAAGLPGASVVNGGANESPGGGGGGGGGTFLIFYNYLTANSGTVTVSGGAGGTGGAVTGSGGTTNGAGGGGGGAGNANNAGVGVAGAVNGGGGAGGAGADGMGGVFQNQDW